MNDSLFDAPEWRWKYPVRYFYLGRVYEKASRDAEARDITDELPPYEPCAECDVCDDDSAWEG